MMMLAFLPLLASIIHTIVGVSTVVNVLSDFSFYRLASLLFADVGTPVAVGIPSVRGVSTASGVPAKSVVPVVRVH
jgi:hypothetical protein